MVLIAVEKTFSNALFLGSESELDEDEVSLAKVDELCLSVEYGRLLTIGRAVVRSATHVYRAAGPLRCAKADNDRDDRICSAISND